MTVNDHLLTGDIVAVVDDTLVLFSSVEECNSWRGRWMQRRTPVELKPQTLYRGELAMVLATRAVGTSNLAFYLFNDRGVFGWCLNVDIRPWVTTAEPQEG